MNRHFNATGFVVQGDRTLLHWHQRLQQWMPPGGHIEPQELAPPWRIAVPIAEDVRLLAIKAIETARHGSGSDSAL